MDTVTPEKRSEMMSGIKNADTKIEVLIRSCLFRKGYRFRKNVRGMPGKPDVLLPKYRTVLFVHGCFWHGHKNCKKFRLPKSRIGFWRDKIGANIERDERNIGKLENDGWKVGVFWECQIEKNLEGVLQRMEELIHLDSIN